MKIKTIHIENFRCFKDETIYLDKYSCFVGPNGSGKSSILAALNVFFREQNSSLTDVQKLTEEDYFNRNTENPIRITVTFCDISQHAQEELAAYVRQGELVVTVEALFDTETKIGLAKHYGQRFGMSQFRPFFEAEKAGMKAAELTTIYDGFRHQIPDLPNPRSKDEKADALHLHEATHPELCIFIPSEDNFYGFNSTGKLAKYVQWIFVPAVKNVCDEEQESKNSALGKLITRTVRTRINFDAEVESLRNEAQDRYRELITRNQDNLTEISQSLQHRLEFWAHPNVRFGIEWIFDPNKSVTIQQPIAGIKTGEGDFFGSLARMGNGLQRSYLLALLQELANSEAPDAPTLILGCEEPELYQHPPQARHLANVLYELSSGNNQILVTTHSPLFVSGDGFEDVRLVQRKNSNTGTKVRGITFINLCERIRSATGDDPRNRNEGLIAKIHQSLQPGIAEMFFARVPILLEGLEDISYITTELHLANLWNEFRRLGCHLVAVNGKDRLLQPLAIARELGIPVFVIFDSDEDTKKEDHRLKHEKDNRSLITLLGAAHEPFPKVDIWERDHIIWRTNITDVIKGDFKDSYDRLTNKARQHYAQEGGLEKNDLFIAEWLSSAFREDIRSMTLSRICQTILDFARSSAE